MTPLEFYQQQANQQTLAAETATLLNVRDRCLRAAAAWSELAARAQRTESSRARLAEEKAEEKEGKADKDAYSH